MMQDLAAGNIYDSLRRVEKTILKYLFSEPLMVYDLRVLVLMKMMKMKETGANGNV